MSSGTEETFWKGKKDPKNCSHNNKIFHFAKIAKLTLSYKSIIPEKKMFLTDKSSMISQVLINARSSYELWSWRQQNFELMIYVFFYGNKSTLITSVIQQWWHITDLSNKFTLKRTSWLIFSCVYLEAFPKLFFSFLKNLQVAVVAKVYIYIFISCQ